MKLNPVPGVAVVVGFVVVVTAPKPNVGNAVVVVAPNETVDAGLTNGVKPNAVVVVAGIAVGVNVGSEGCVAVVVDRPKLPKAGG